MLTASYYSNGSISCCRDWSTIFTWWRQVHPSNTCFLGPARLHTPSGVLIGSTVCAVLPVVTSRPRCSVSNRLAVVCIDAVQKPFMHFCPGIMSVMLSLGLKTKFFGLGLDTFGLCLVNFRLGLELCGLVNITKTAHSCWHSTLFFNPKYVKHYVCYSQCGTPR